MAPASMIWSCIDFPENPVRPEWKSELRIVSTEWKETERVVSSRPGSHATTKTLRRDPIIEACHYIEVGRGVWKKEEDGTQVPGAEVRRATVARGVSPGCRSTAAE